jgi:hypothetical protein
MKLRNNKQLRDRITSMESENADVRVNGQEQTSVVQQNQTKTSENDRQRDTDLQSVQLGTTGTMDMMQIGVILMRLEESIKDSQIVNQRKMKEMENRLKDSQNRCRIL